MANLLRIYSKVSMALDKLIFRKLDKGILILANFMKIIFASNSKSDFEFTHHFIKTFTTKLEPQIQADAFQWAIAHTAYKEKNLSTISILIKYK